MAIGFNGLLVAVALLVSSGTANPVESPTNGCDFGWSLFEANCYYVVKTEMNFYSAMGLCMQLSAEPVIVTTEAKREFLERYLPGGNPGTWVGARLNDKSQEYEWFTGQAVNETIVSINRVNSCADREACDCRLSWFKQTNGNNAAQLWQEDDCSANNYPLCTKPQVKKSVDTIIGGHYSGSS